MGGRQCPDAAGLQEIQDGDREGRAFRRIGSRAQLVKQTQAVPVAAAENIHNGGHVRREGRERLLNTLLIPDIREDFPEQGQLAVVRGRNMQAGHAHELQQTDRFERDGFAACVRAGDNDHVDRLRIFSFGAGIFREGPQRQIDGDDFFRIDQRVTAVPENNPVFAVENGTRRILPQRKTCPREDKVQRRHVPGVVLQRHQRGAGLCGEIGEDPLDFLLFLQCQLAEFIVQRDDGGGLDEDGGAGGGLVMHDAGDLGFELCPDRQTVAVIPDGDDGILQIGCQRDIDHFLQLGVNPVAGREHGAADAAQLGAGVVGHLFLRQNAAADFPRKLRQRDQTVKQIVQDVLLIFFHGAVVVHPGHILQKRGKAQQLSLREAGFHSEGPEQIRKIAIAPEGNFARAQQAGDGTRSLILGALDLTQIIHGQDASAQLPAGIGGRLFLEKSDYFIKFNDSQNFFIHDFLFFSTFE